MSRLYDRLLRDGCSIKGVGDTSRLIGPDRLRDAVVVEASNVCSYYYQGSIQENWDLHSDFPNLAPAFESCFVEMKAPKKIASEVHGLVDWHRDAPTAWAAYVEATDVSTVEADLEPGTAFLTTLRERFERRYGRELQQLAADAHREGIPGGKYKEAAVSAFGEQTAADLGRLAALVDTENMALRSPQRMEKMAAAAEKFRWIVGYHVFLEFGKSNIVGPLLEWRLLIKEDGAPLPQTPGLIGSYMARTDQQAVNQIYAELSPFFHPAFLTTCFLHCNNVARDAVDPPPKASRKHLREHGRELTRYHTLRIDPIKQILEHSGRASQEGLQRALHLCRGHFKTYTPQAPLMGKHTGTYFWGPQLRGSGKAGEVRKDYSIGEPEAAAKRTRGSE